ncbi:methyltransferase domain-containing protein [Candidatus Woesearchaeota archaeon]|nr:methyltransferase domain-containing protein [Candidatus Woesearchaeota archaeon]
MKKDLLTNRDVVMHILKRDLKDIHNKKVLEIGPGRWDFAKNILEKNNCRWYGLEPLDFGEDNLTMIKGSVDDIPFHDSSFDIVLCNQSMEHWFEYNVSLKKALKEIHRVLKPESILMINAPIHNHGDPRFLMGELKKIRASFKKNMWNILLFEKAFPDKKVQGWKKIAANGFFSKLGYPDFLIPNPKDATTYTLDIHAQKKKKKNKKKKSQNRSIRNLIVILRFIKKYIRTRITYG